MAKFKVLMADGYDAKKRLARKLNKLAKKRHVKVVSFAAYLDPDEEDVFIMVVKTKKRQPVQ